MSTKDYKRLAQALLDARPIGPQTTERADAMVIQWNITVENVVYALATEPKTRFDPDKFRKACGYTGG